MIRQILIPVLLAIGTFFAVVAALGVVRMPDLFMRLSAATKATTLGACSLLLAVALYFGDLGVTGQVAAIIFFIVLTVPVSAHMIGRAAYFNDVPLWEKTVCDELRGRLDKVADRDSAKEKSATRHQERDEGVPL